MNPERHVFQVRFVNVHSPDILLVVARRPPAAPVVLNDVPGFSCFDGAPSPFDRVRAVLESFGWRMV